MRFLFCLVIVGFVTLTFGQSKPDQIKLREDYLWGKSPYELRVMRNEIFARYGLIFKSEDLKAYFSSKKWYKPIYKNVDSYLTEIDRINIKTISDFENSKASLSTQTVVDSAVVKYIMINAPSTTVHRRLIEVSYPEYNWKKTVETTSNCCEDLKVITIEYSNESSDNKKNKQYWEMKKYVDDIQIHYNYIQTIEFDLVDDYNEIYPFFSDEPIVRYDGNKYMKFRIPNSGIPHFWIGYSYTAGKKEKVGAKVYLSDINGIINELSIISKSGRTGYLEDEGFKLIFSNSNDKIDNPRENLYEMWSSEKSKKREDINEFKITIDGVFSIEIPVIKGYLYGNQEKYQTITID